MQILPTIELFVAKMLKLSNISLKLIARLTMEIVRQYNVVTPPCTLDGPVAVALEHFKQKLNSRTTCKFCPPLNYLWQRCWNFQAFKKKSRLTMEIVRQYNVITPPCTLDGPVAVALEHFKQKLNSRKTGKFRQSLNYLWQRCWNFQKKIKN